MIRRRMMSANDGGKPPLSVRINSLLPNLYWKLDDVSGLFAEANGRTSNTLNLMPNPGFETHTGADFSVWDEVPSDGTISAETTIVHAGGSTVSCKLTQGTGATRIQNSIVNGGHGRTYDIHLWNRGDGTHGGRYGVFDDTHGVWLVPLGTETGVTGTTWTDTVATISMPGAVGGGVINFRLILYAPAAAGGICYFDDISVIGQNFSMAGMPVGAPTYGSDAIGGSKSVLLNGSSLINIFADGALANLWTYPAVTALTVLVWAKPTFIWATEATNRDLYSAAGVDGNQVIVGYYASAGHNLDWRHFGNGTNIDRTIADNPAGNWFAFCQVIDGTVQRPYYNGIAQTTDNLGTWTAGALTVGVIANAAQITSFHSWIGNLAHFAIWFRALTPAEVLKVSVA